jgi:hypothetical protein
MGDKKPGRGPKKSAKKAQMELSKELAPKTKK